MAAPLIFVGGRIALGELLAWLGLGTTATVVTMAAVENMNEANKAAGSSQSGTTSYTDACSSCQPPEDDEENDETSKKPSNYDKMTAEDKRAVRSLQRQIKKHHQKINDFKNNPTVRPGMENQPADVIAKQQQARIDHLYREIRAFENNIYKINNKYW